MKSANDINKESYADPRTIGVYDQEPNRGSELRVYEKYFAAPGKILDLGCGTGRTSIALAKRGLSVEAVDYSETMIDHAKQKYGDVCHFRVMDAANLSYPENTFNYAFFSFNGLDYLYPDTNRKKALSEVRRVLKPGGIFAFSSHNAVFIPNNLYRWYTVLRSFVHGKIHPYRVEFHPFGKLITRYISPKAEIRELEEAGFELLELISKYGTTEAEIRHKDPYPTYVCRKKKHT